MERATARPDRKRLLMGALLALWLAVEVVWGYCMAVRPDSLPWLLAAAVGLAVVAVTLREPVLGLYLFVAAMLTEAAWMLGSVSAARLLGILVLLAWASRGLASGRFTIVVPAQAWVAALFALWALVSLLWAMDTSRWLTAWWLLAQSVGLYLLVINLLNSMQRLRVVLAIVLVISVALALLTLAQVISGGTNQGRADLGHISVGDWNAQAAYLLPSAALLLVLFGQRSHWLRKLLALLGFSLIVLAILANNSRGAMIALAVMLVLGTLFERSLLQLALPAVLAGGVAALIMPWQFYFRMRDLVTLGDRGSGRIDMWLVALRVIQSHPLRGVGLGGFPQAFDRYLSDTPVVWLRIGRERASHNIFLNVQSELGIVGLVLFALFIAWTLARSLAAVVKCRREGSPASALALVVFLSLAGLVVAAQFLDAQYWKLFWLLLALPEVIQRLPRRASARTASG